MKSQRGPRILSLLFAALLLLSACAGWGNTPSDTAGTQPPGETDAAPNAVSGTEDAAPYHDSVPALDFKGDALIFCVRDMVADEMVVEEASGEITNNAVYNRNSMMEKRFNVTIGRTVAVDTGSGEILDFIRQSLYAMDDSFNAAAAYCSGAGDLILENWFVEWQNVPYVDLDNPWWAVNINDVFTVNGRLYSAVSDLCVTSMQYAYAYLFNQKLAADFGVENLYDVVDEGRWTLDYEYALAKDIYADTNGNGQKDDEDIYGLLTDLNTSLICYLPACEQPFLRLTDDGLEIQVNTERMLSIYDKLDKLFHGTNGVFTIYHGRDGYVYDDKYKLFKNDIALLMPVRLYALYDELSDMTSDYGIIPYPKYDETQEQYRGSCLDGYSTLCVPRSVRDLDMVGALIEALSCESKNSVMPAFYDSALQHRYSRDSRSAKMLDVIMDGRYYDLASLYSGATQGLKNVLRMAIVENTPIASYYASKEEAYENAVEQLYLKLLTLG